jgi:hypothetical protein
VFYANAVHILEVKSEDGHRTVTYTKQNSLLLVTLETNCNKEEGKITAYITAYSEKGRKGFGRF